MRASDFSPLVSVCCAEVLESMYFTTVLEASSHPGQNRATKDDEVAYWLRFQGEVHGSFGLSLDTAMARMLAANFLGEQEEALTEVEVAEVVGELTNMLCGSIVSRLEGTSKFALTHPEPFIHKPADLDILTTDFETDNGMVHTWLTIDPPLTNVETVVNELLQAAH
jgi:CheY-specific phosphatase CheX